MTYISWRKQLTLAIILFILGTTAYWLEFKHKPDSQTQDETNKKIFVLKDNPVQDIVLRNGATSVSIHCLDLASKLCKAGDTSKWELNAPLKLKADDTNVNSLISTLNNVSSTDSIDLKDETPTKKTAFLKDYGLDADSRKKTSGREVEVSLPSGATTLYLGATHPIGDGIFALVQKNGKIDDSKVLIIPAYFKSTLDHELAYWRDKKVLAISAREIEGFRLRGSKGDIEGVRRDGQWVLKSKNQEFAGDIENIDNLLTGATFISASSFASDSKIDVKAKAALKGTHRVLSLTLNRAKGTSESSPPVILTLFQKPATKKKTSPGKIYASVSSQDPLYVLENNAKERLDKNLKDLRLEKLITSMERFTVKRLEFSGKPVGQQPLILNHIDNKWFFDTDKTEVALDSVQGFLDKISGNRIKDFVTGSAVPKGENEGLKITLGDDKNPNKRQLIFWKAAGKLFARDLNAKSRDAFWVDSTVQDGLPWKRDFFRKAK